MYHEITDDPKEILFIRQSDILLRKSMNMFGLGVDHILMYER
jgi:hypothetical protein